MTKTLVILTTCTIFYNFACSGGTTSGGGTPTSTPDAAREMESAESPLTPAPVDCGSLSDGECLTSTACILEDIEDSSDYLCRPAQSHCETNFAQWRPDPEHRTANEAVVADCVAREGCSFKPGICYCLDNDAVVTIDGGRYGGLRCRCSGGPPPTCSEAPPAS